MSVVGAFVALEWGLRWLAVGDQRATVAVVILQGLPDFEEILVGFFIAHFWGSRFDADRIEYGQSIARRRQVAGIEQSNRLVCIATVFLFANADPI